MRRVALHHELYRDSAGNHAFPLVALHGALWGHGFFETTGKLGTVIAYRYFLDADERKIRHAMLDRFAEGFKAVNREVFVDTYTNYWFTKAHGRAPGAEELVHPDLLLALNEAHAATAAGHALGPDRALHLFTQALRFEQEVTVAPGIARELAISVHTCRGYVKALLSKLGAHSQLEAVASARAQGLLDDLRR